MVAIMTMTAVHMHDHDHNAAAAGLVIAIHIGAMSYPRPDRLARRPLPPPHDRRYLGAGCWPPAAGIAATNAPDDSVAAFAVALTLLGLGWNFGLVTGTAIITDAIPLATRAKNPGPGRCLHQRRSWHRLSCLRSSSPPAAIELLPAAARPTSLIPVSSSDLRSPTLG
ncbi:hypothetical protein ACLMAJ_04415 [Nocardia sp. KC 131]|uniref:hypothetical protein n=1 Tax=Nocardia arseniciresistens TaxID=3392119 RepID=UPI00398F5E06